MGNSKRRFNMSDWKDLTDYEIEEILLKQDRFWKEEEGVGGELFIEVYGEKFALAIQEALRVKNEAPQQLQEQDHE
jgi:hypothetical protein